MLAIAIFAAALATAVATGLGALPFAVSRHGLRRWLGPANGAASGVMLVASASLLIEGADRSGSRTALGGLAGVVFVCLAYRVVGDQPALTLGTLVVPAVERAAQRAEELCLVSLALDTPVHVSMAVIAARPETAALA
jgi:ZIP family zinc transporter